MELGTELRRGSPRAPGRGKRLSLIKPPVPHQQHGKMAERARWDPYGKLNPSSLTAPGGQRPRVLHVMVSNESHRSLFTAIPNRHLPN